MVYLSLETTFELGTSGREGGKESDGGRGRRGGRCESEEMAKRAHSSRAANDTKHTKT